MVTDRHPGQQDGMRANPDTPPNVNIASVIALIGDRPMRACVTVIGGDEIGPGSDKGVFPNRQLVKGSEINIGPDITPGPQMNTAFTGLVVSQPENRPAIHGHRPTKGQAARQWSAAADLHRAINVISAQPLRK